MREAGAPNGQAKRRFCRRRLPRLLSGSGVTRRWVTALFCALLTYWGAAGLGSSALHATPGQVLAVRDDVVSLRAAPHGDARVILRLTPDHRLIEFERRHGWVRVGVFQVVGAFGWVPAGALVPPPRPPSPPEPPPAAAAEPAPEPPFRLEIAGSPAVLYRGECSLVGRSGAGKTVKLAGSIPRHYVFAAEAVSCLVRKWDSFGRLRVRLFQEDRLIARKGTAAPFNHVRVRSAGPWGGARATRGAIRIIDTRSRGTETPETAPR